MRESSEFHHPHAHKSRTFVTLLALVAMLALSSLVDAQTSQPSTQTGRRGGARGPAPQSVSPRDALPWTAGDFTKLNPALPSLIICGDSTADKGPDAWHRGWAALLIDYFDASKINVVNRARGGRSFRTFVHEGLWDQIVAAVKPGDYVMIQLGHNDGGDVNAANGRPDLPGLGEETQTVIRADGTSETVRTFGWYTRKFVKDVRDKNATPILMSTTVYNRWNEGKMNRTPSTVNKWTRQVADAEKVQFLDHNSIICDRYDQLGQEAVQPFFKADFLHTTTLGGIVNAEMFVAGVKGLNIPVLVDALNEKGKTIEAYKPPAATP
jgi:lysophospholipase L1-like esterase